ncbi:DUF5988 family protein [Micromonospora sp. WMMD998]|uniref:DUF5988 family protein n=1 Tax=Micromonospora sp. WMMD998 TaxID=3016092 RepID=UPI00249A490C|nr:DUF5988 family protein [Micromonospora sp. WMMD998]WFE39930.1 DUF5988 family protein [Micromonospora sp. WMMD998]
MSDNVQILLTGGPRDLASDRRTLQLDASPEKIKIEHLGGYEHFEPTGEHTTDGHAVVFRWTTRTRIAE